MALHKVAFMQTFQTTKIFSSDLFASNAKYLQTLFEKKWRFFANILPNTLKLLFTVHKVVSQLLRPR